MHGWTFEMAGEYWLPSVISEKNPQTPEEVANLNEVNVQIHLPVHESNPMPRDGVTYRQVSTGGFITFHLTPVEGDTLHPIGTMDMLLKEPGYREQDTLKDVRLLSYGKGIFTAYHIERHIKKTRQQGEPDGYTEHVAWNPIIISVYPGADSLIISRGNMLYDAYVAE